MVSNKTLLKSGILLFLAAQSNSKIKAREMVLRNLIAPTLFLEMLFKFPRNLHSLVTLFSYRAR